MSRSCHRLFRRAVCASLIAGLSLGQVPAGYAADSDPGSDRQDTATPIKHVMIIIGENRTFDHVFGTYKPRDGQTISNLLSKGIVKADGTPGPNFAASAQFRTVNQGAYFISPNTKTPYNVLPPPDLAGTHNQASDVNPPPFATVAVAGAVEHDLAPSDIALLTTGATGLSTTTGVDTRVANATNLRNGMFQLTGPSLPYDAYTGDTIHRFYQMWQQSDCSAQQATTDNPSGCLNDLYPFVASTEAANSAGGGTPMAFYNVGTGDAPYLKQLADQYTMSDNYHQAQMGGTAVEHLFLGMADDVFYSDGKGNAVTPPAALIANPNPKSGTVNQYTLDGWYAGCADSSQPGVGPIVSYLGSLEQPVSPNCAPNHYYLINNLNPGFKVDGSVNTSPSAVPPSNVRTIGDALMEKGISFRYYGGGFNDAVAGKPNAYCAICNPFQYVSSIMGNSAARTEHVKDVQDLFSDIANNTLPAVSYVKPDGLLDGHPQSSKLGLFEAFTRNIIEKIQANPALFAETAIIVTFDEGGGYYDSGYVQPLDFQGDGPRIPFIVVSPHSKGGRVVHTYDDHASVVKFIERNWHLNVLTDRSRDNLPNPIASEDNPYVPVNSPAIGNLFDMFHFDQDRDGQGRDRG